jgi:uncharacterized protein (TIRG00374 family)
MPKTPQPAEAGTRGGFLSTTSPHLVSWAAVVGVGALVALFVSSDLGKVWELAAGVNPVLLVIPAFFALASYITMALSYQGIARAAGARVPSFEMFKVTVVGNTVNYIVSTGGLSGFAVRMYFFIRMGVASDTAVIISLVQTFITNVILLLCVVFGFTYLLTSHELKGLALGTTTAFLSLSVMATAVAVILLLKRSWRRRTLFVLAEAANALLHRFAPARKPARVSIWRFQRNLNRGIEFLLQRKRHMIVPTLWIVGDWAATIMILHSAFWIIGYPVSVSVVIVGFSVGIVLSIVSFVPGGLGIMEGSMAAIFVSLSVPLETAVVAVLIFRISYYFLPMVISLFFFRNMLMQGTRAAPQQVL